MAMVTVVKPLDGPRYSQWEVVQAEHLAQVLPAGGADGPQRVAAALKLCYCHILVSVRLQELQSTLVTWSSEGECKHIKQWDIAEFLYAMKTHGLVAVRVAEFSELALSQIFELVLLSAHGEDWLWKSYTQSYSQQSVTVSSASVTVMIKGVTRAFLLPLSVSH